jgi:outer membrane protein assembly factor BamE (lipoprotein component of BamABCDE complex)
MRLSIKFVTIAAMIALATVTSGSSTAKAQNQRVRATVGGPVVEQPLQSEYKGVRLGMTTDEARAKLGQPALKADDQDYYVFSETETATVAYDRTHKVVTISVDYQNGVGAPDYRTVVGDDMQTRADGSLHKVVRRESQGYWVSYSRTAPGTVVIVTITIQKL